MPRPYMHGLSTDPLECKVHALQQHMNARSTIGKIRDT